MVSMLDLYKKRAEEFLKASFYTRRPVNNATLENSVRFGYSIINESDKTRVDLLGNLSATSVVMTIKTDDDLPFASQEPFGYVVDEDGGLWMVLEKITNVMQDHSRQALRIRKKPFATTTMRLQKIENKRGLQ